MTGRKRTYLVLAGTGLLATAAIAYLWIDGGEEPLHPIAEPVPLPELPR